MSVPASHGRGAAAVEVDPKVRSKMTQPVSELLGGHTKAGRLPPVDHDQKQVPRVLGKSDAGTRVQVVATGDRFPFVQADAESTDGELDG